MLQFLLGALETYVRKFQKDKPEYGNGLLGRFEFGISAQFIRRIPKAFFNMGRVGNHTAILSDSAQLVN